MNKKVQVTQMSRVFAPIPFAVAVLFVSAPLIGSVGATAVAKNASARPAATRAWMAASS